MKLVSVILVSIKTNVRCSANNCRRNRMYILAICGIL